MTPALRELLDRQVITDVLHLYCRGCDRADEALLRACFHADSTHRHGGFAGTSSDFVTFAIRIIGRALVTKHVLTNISIEVAGHTAFVESHYCAYHRTLDRHSGGPEDQFSGGRYLDRFEKRAGRWRIASRIGLIDYERVLEPAERTLVELPATARSRRLPDDALYQVVGIDATRRVP